MHEKLSDSIFDNKLRFGDVKNKYHTKKNNPECHTYKWIVLKPREDMDGELYNPKCCILINLN